MVLTIINIILVIIMAIMLIWLYNMMNSFGELIVRFIEKNQEYFKNQKHLLDKSSSLASESKKLSSSISSLRKLSTAMERQANKEKK